jgi:hypothetical protein
MARRRLKIESLILTALLSLSILFFSNSILTRAATGTTVYVDPPATIGLPPAATFTIKVKVANISRFYGLDLQFTWEPSVIQYVSHVKKIPKDGTPAYPDGVLYKPTLNVRDQVDENASMPGSEPGTRYWLSEAAMLPAPVFNGSGTIFEMTFRVMSIGYSPIRIIALTLADKEGNPIAATINNGYFDNRPTPPPPKPANFTITPSSIVNSSLDPCHNFTIDVEAEVEILYSYDFMIGYNATILEVVGVTGNPLFPPPTIIYATGQIDISSSLTPPSPPINGTLSLVSVKFHIIGKGESPLDLHDVAIKDKNGAALPVNEVNDGYFNNMIITKMFVDPPEIIDPYMKPGDIFTIDIDIQDAIGMYDYKYKLGFDRNVIICLGAVVIPPNNDTHFNLQQIINNTNGVVWVYVQYYAPAPPINIHGAKAVTRITFMVRNYGQTVLDLYDADVSTPSGGSLNPVIGDGFFATLLTDVAIMFVNVTSPNKVYPGKIVTIQVIAMNRGNFTTETFNVTLHYSSNVIGVQTVTVGPWSNVTLTFHWDTTGQVPCHNFTIWAEASHVPFELKFDNNVYYDGWVKIKMLGDVNGDGVIDILDIVLISIAYGSRPGYPNWNPEADLVPPYGFIDILDLVTCSSKYGWHC